MKRAIILVSVLSGFTGVTLNSSAATTNSVAYDLSAVWTNLEATVWDVGGFPRTPTAALPSLTPQGVTIVDTDAAGKITGNGSMEILYNAAGVPFSRYVVDEVGRIASSSSAATPVVTLSIKGTGFTTDSTGFSTPSRLNLRFKGQPGPNPSNPSQIRIVGTLEGTITGPTPLGPKSAKLSGLVALISTSSSGFAGFSVSILQGGKAMQVLDPRWTGRGSITTSNGYRLTVTGRGFNRGSALQLSGVLGPHTNNFQGNPFSFTAPLTVTGKGKISGQAVTLSTGPVSANLISN